MLRDDELITIQGGALKGGIIAIIGAGVVFIIGVSKSKQRILSSDQQPNVCPSFP